MFTITAAVLAAAALALIGEALDRRQERRDRDLERTLGIGRYQTGCPSRLTKADIDADVSAYVRRRIDEIACEPGVAAFARTLKSLDGRTSALVGATHG